MNIAEILGISSVSDVNVTNQTENVENTNEDFASYLNASTTTMDDIFNKASETYNVPVALLKAMAKQESNFDPNATSSSGAQGVMQLMPATAASLDVSVYATWQYLAEEIQADGYQTVMIPGVTSFCAAAAAANTGLTQRDLPLHIVPASYGNLEKQMQPEGNYVLMKAGKCMDEIHRVLETKPGVREVFSIKNCGLPGEVVKDGLLENEAYGYFTTVIVKE